MQLFKQLVRIQQNSGTKVYPDSQSKRTSIANQKLQGEL